MSKRTVITRNMKFVGDLRANGLGDIKNAPKAGFKLKPPGKRKGGTGHQCQWIRGAEIEICTKCGTERPLTQEVNA